MVKQEATNTKAGKRLEILCRGQVQGLGFRPGVKQLADSYGLAGWALNTLEGVVIELEGDPQKLDTFLESLRARPFRGLKQLELTTRDIPATGDTAFEILPSLCAAVDNSIAPPPDLSLCEDCKAELSDKHNRRFNFPLISCNQCGPRYSIIEQMPFDRERSSYRDFPMCRACRQEYSDPGNRRFHAQTISCPDCGPGLSLLGGSDLQQQFAQGDEIPAVADRLKKGGVGLIKGGSGFHLVADADCTDSVARLRTIKQRQRKPFALMYPSIEKLQAHCPVTPAEQDLLQSEVHPLVLLQGKADKLPESYEQVMPGLANLLVMLPYNGIYYLLLQALNRPLVVTSANLSGNPVCFTLEEVKKHFSGVVDFVLDHSLALRNPQDDSICQLVMNKRMTLRPGRGLSPLDWKLPASVSNCWAEGALLKNTVGIAVADRLLLSQYIGDLDNDAVLERKALIKDRLSLFTGCNPQQCVVDAHPDFSRNPDKNSKPLFHHVAHARALQGEHNIRGDFLAVTWDGFGYGENGTIQGGEFFRVGGGRFDEEVEHIGTLKAFRLPGLDAASREPRRMGLSLLYSLFGESAASIHKKLYDSEVFNEEEYRVLISMMSRGVNSPECSSMGRLIDGIASLLDLCHYNTYEAEAALILQALASNVDEKRQNDHDLPMRPTLFTLEGESFLTVDWKPCIQYLLEAIKKREEVSDMVDEIYCSLSNMIIEFAKRSGLSSIALGGGCFQNRLLVEAVARAAQSNSMNCYWAQDIPANDSGIAFGQAFAYSQKGDY